MDMRRIIALILLAFACTQIHADPYMTNTTGVDRCISMAHIYWSIAYDLHAGVTLRSAVNGRIHSTDPSWSRNYVQQAIEQIYNQPQITADTWFGFELAYCETLPPASDFIIVPAPIN
jgi:hypothetical protein